MKKFIITIILLYALIVTLSGCSESSNDSIETEQPIHAVLVLGSTSNTPKLNISATADLLDRICSQGGSVAIIVADGQPYLFDEIDVPEIDSSYSKSKKKQIAETRVTEIISIIEEALAKEPHADYLEAIRMASRIIHSFNDQYEKHIVIFGSCLSDVAPLNFSEMYLDNIDIEKIICNLNITENIPTLDGCYMTVYNCGDTVAPQKPLSNIERKILQEVWEGILYAGNPEKVTFATNLPTQLIYEGLPEVDTVPVVSESNELEEKENVEQLEMTDAVIFDETVINFKPNTAELINPQLAIAAIDEVSQYMKENPEKNALLIGCTAQWGSEQDCLCLSFERALAVQKLFIDTGIREDRLKVVGTGFLSLFYKNDKGQDGNLDELIAPQNRSVIWVDAESSLAELIWKSEEVDKFLIDK